ncbi:hypothetical protein K504DRAFT_135342 [Pleomassaria siparia CBS 279.74]|uniref:Uncharacterized protein n=1 Tax=Pleomassaria siparia CBS 279.74 TaxID=1314801 RepID=A0A6G1KKK6_9PLEO|nr:hypothetical protein K504DRAFT_135342 [Pleomassaria siparia CBS 279.74]
MVCLFIHSPLLLTSLLTLQVITLKKTTTTTIYTTASAVVLVFTSQPNSNSKFLIHFHFEHNPHLPLYFRLYQHSLRFRLDQHSLQLLFQLQPLIYFESNPNPLTDQRLSTSTTWHSVMDRESSLRVSVPKRTSACAAKSRDEVQDAVPVC